MEEAAGGAEEEAGEGCDTAHIRRMSKNWPIWARGAPMVYSLVSGGLSFPWFFIVFLCFCFVFRCFPCFYRQDIMLFSVYLYLHLCTTQFIVLVEGVSV